MVQQLSAGTVLASGPERPELPVVLLRSEGDAEPVRLRLRKAVVGEGSYAAVFRGELLPPKGSGASAATQPTVVAVKLLHRKLLQDAEQVELFQQEMRLLRTLNHSNIAKYMGCNSWASPALDDSARGQAGQLQTVTSAKGSPPDLFYALEFCGGGSLGELVRRQMIRPFKPLYSDADALRWSLHIARALQYLHDSHPAIIHRDLKLDNVLLSSAKVAHADAKLVDFGLARHLLLSSACCGKASLPRLALTRKIAAPEPSASMQPAGSGGSSSSGSDSGGSGSSSHMTGRTGSLGYMAPEVLSSRQYCCSADVFSLGMVMHNLFARCIPGIGFTLNHPIGSKDDPMELYAAKVAEGYRPPLPSCVPTVVAEVIEACWKGDPALRPSAGIVVAKLESIQASGELGGTPSDTPMRGCSGCIVM